QSGNALGGRPQPRVGSALLSVHPATCGARLYGWIWADATPAGLVLPPPVEKWVELRFCARLAGCSRGDRPRDRCRRPHRLGRALTAARDEGETIDTERVFAPGRVGVE